MEINNRFWSPFDAMNRKGYLFSLVGLVAVYASIIMSMYQVFYEPKEDLPRYMEIHNKCKVVTQQECTDIYKQLETSDPEFVTRISTSFIYAMILAIPFLVCLFFIWLKRMRDIFGRGGTQFLGMLFMFNFILSLIPLISVVTVLIPYVFPGRISNQSKLLTNWFKGKI